jgi:hypothetical protein
MDLSDWDSDLLKALQEMIPRIEGKPCVNIDTMDRKAYTCRRIGELAIEEDAVYGMCEWVDPAEARPDELTDGLAISQDGLQVGPDWWLDTYFNWYLVFTPELVARSLAGDHSWVDEFLAKVEQ